MDREIDLRPIPVLPAPPTAGDDDAPSALDRALIASSTHAAGGVLTAAVGLLLGLPADWALLSGFLVGYVVFIWGQRLPFWHFTRGLYRRSLDLAERLESRAWLLRHRSNWRLQRAACHIMLGDLDRAKGLLRTIERQSLSLQDRAVLDIDLAVLYCRMVAPDSALAVLDEIDPQMLPRRFVPFYHLARASAFNLKDEFASVLTEVSKVEDPAPSPEFMTACLTLKALVRLEADGDAAQALLLSNSALGELGPGHPVRPGILVTHARIALEATGDTRECLEILSGVFGHEPELGLSGQAELQYLLARCYRESGLVDDARRHLARAAELPASARLRKRIQALATQLVTGPDAMAGPPEGRESPDAAPRRA